MTTVNVLGRISVAMLTSVVLAATLLVPADAAQADPTDEGLTNFVLPPVDSTVAELPFADPITGRWDTTVEPVAADPADAEPDPVDLDRPGLNEGEAITAH